jgi:ribosomal protein L2
MAIKQFKPMTPGDALPGDLADRRDHPEGSREVARRGAAPEGRPEPPRPHHDAPPRRSAQAEVPDHRLQAQQVRRAGRVTAIEYDPNRSANIALIEYQDGERRYILHPRRRGRADDDLRTRVGHPARQRDAARGDPARYHGAQHRAAPRQGRPDGRSAGAGVQVIAKEGDFVTLRMPSTEMRMVRRECMATIGQVGNVDHSKQSIGKAGANRWRGQRPEGPRRRDEPGRPPAGRRRGPQLGRTPPGLPVGPEGRREDAEAEEGLDEADRPRPEARQGDE